MSPFHRICRPWIRNVWGEILLLQNACNVAVVIFISKEAVLSCSLQSSLTSFPFYLLQAYQKLETLYILSLEDVKISTKTSDEFPIFFDPFTLLQFSFLLRFHGNSKQTDGQTWWQRDSQNCIPMKINAIPPSKSHK